MSLSHIGVIVAHPDDEVLGFGGVMARHAARGDAVHVLILATGLTARANHQTIDTSALEDLRDQARQANHILGAANVTFAGFPDNRMDSVPLLDIIQRVEGFLTEIGADTIYTHHPGDLNIDHVITARAALTACRTLPGAPQRRIYAGEVLSSSEFTFAQQRFQPTSYCDVSAHLDQKCRALEAYRGEIRAWPHPRSTMAVRALAALRGSEIGVEAAEALAVLREIIP